MRGWRFMHWAASAALLFVSALRAPADAPHLGYAYPAGGRVGTTFEVELGGQRLKDVRKVVVGGAGVTARVLRYGVKYDAKQVRSFARNRENLMAQLKTAEGKERKAIEARLKKLEARASLAILPEGVDPYDKRSVAKYYRERRKDQFNPQIAERLIVEATIAPGAPPGERTLRVETAKGISNPVFFEVGTLSEFDEREPNDDHLAETLQPLDVPVLINGRAMPGDVDHFRLRLRKGQSIVVNVAARRIVPYLADAVPGWFQAVAALYDDSGREVAYDDDFRFAPDPVLFFKVPKTGDYVLSVRDSIYRGREDFVYRIAVGELPFLTALFPLGGRRGETASIRLSGWNLPKERIEGQLVGDEPTGIRRISVKRAGYRSNRLPFAVGDDPETFEGEPNDSPASAFLVSPPVVVNGRIAAPDDRDVFRFEGRKGEKIVIEVAARRLDSPLDSILRLSGPGLETPLRNDDFVRTGPNHLFLGDGLVTHHADSRLVCELPCNGVYFAEIGDVAGHGGADYAYRLRIAPAHPDFELYVSPSGMHVAPGGTAVGTLRVVRKEGFDGAVEVKATGLPEGYSGAGGTIPAGRDSASFTLTAPPNAEKGIEISPRWIGRACIEGDLLERTAVPADDLMQAFLYRHLVSAEELTLRADERPSPVSFSVRPPKNGKTAFYVPLGGECWIGVDGAGRGPNRRGATLRLVDPPEGLSLSKGWIGPPKGGERGDRTLKGGFLLDAASPLKPGDRLDVVVEAVIKRGKNELRFPAPAFSVRIAAPKP